MGDRRRHRGHVVDRYAPARPDTTDVIIEARTVAFACSKQKWGHARKIVPIWAPAILNKTGVEVIFNMPAGQELQRRDVMARLYAFTTDGGSSVWLVVAIDLLRGSWARMRRKSSVWPERGRPVSAGDTRGCSPAGPNLTWRHRSGDHRRHTLSTPPTRRRGRLHESDLFPTVRRTDDLLWAQVRCVPAAAVAVAFDPPYSPAWQEPRCSGQVNIGRPKINRMNDKGGRAVTQPISARTRTQLARTSPNYSGRWSSSLIVNGGSTRSRRL